MGTDGICGQRGRYRFATDHRRKTPPKCARIAITPATVRPARGAAIVEVVRDESLARIAR